MASSLRPYRRLPGRLWFSLVGRYSIWLGSDHLLCVWNHYFTEDYKRFYFQDVQAIVIGETQRRRTLGIVFAIFAALFALLALVTGRNPAALFPGILFLLSVALLVGNWARGPTCVCRLRTAVQTEELACLRRLRVAQKVARLIQSRVEAAQGRLSRSDLQSRMETRAAELAGARVTRLPERQNYEAETRRAE